VIWWDFTNSAWVTTALFTKFSGTKRPSSSTRWDIVARFIEAIERVIARFYTISTIYTLTKEYMWTTAG